MFHFLTAKVHRTNRKETTINRFKSAGIDSLIGAIRCVAAAIALIIAMLTLGELSALRKMGTNDGCGSLGLNRSPHGRGWQDSSVSVP